jgi:hypothetical protein
MALALAADSTMTTFMKAFYRAPSGVVAPVRWERPMLILYLLRLPSGGREHGGRLRRCQTTAPVGITAIVTRSDRLASVSLDMTGA